MLNLEKYLFFKSLNVIIASLNNNLKHKTYVCSLISLKGHKQGKGKAASIIECNDLLVYFLTLVMLYSANTRLLSESTNSLCLSVRQSNHTTMRKSYFLSCYSRFPLSVMLHRYLKIIKKDIFPTNLVLILTNAYWISDF